MKAEIIKLYADLILERSIQITPYESGNQILFKYNHNSIISTIIKKNMYSYLHEYNDATILRDEVYTSYYESLLKLITKEQYTQEDMNIIVNDLNEQAQEITQTFSKLLIGYTNNLLKMHLTDTTRRSKATNEYISTKIIYNNEVLEFIPQEEQTEDTEEIHNPLYNLLTESQKQYVNNERVYANRDTERRMKNRIKTRVNTLSEEQKEELLSIAKTKEEIVNEVLDIEDNDRFVSRVRTEQKHQWFSDLIVEYVPLNHRVDFNKNNITDKTVMEFRKALFKALDRL